jgi:DNA-binding transcriptional MerR regulator
MQWWDERKLVSPRIKDHRRVYIPEQVLEILTVAALRRKRLSLQRIRKVLRLLRRELGQRGGRLLAGKSKSAFEKHRHTASLRTMSRIMAM